MDADSGRRDGVNRSHLFMQQKGSRVTRSSRDSTEAGKPKSRQKHPGESREDKNEQYWCKYRAKWTVVMMNWSSYQFAMSVEIWLQESAAEQDLPIEVKVTGPRGVVRVF